MYVIMYMYVRTYVCMYVCMYVTMCMYVHTYIRTYVHTYLRMYVRIMYNIMCMYQCLYGAPLAQRASYLSLHSSLFEQDYVCIVTNSISSVNWLKMCSQWEHTLTIVEPIWYICMCIYLLGYMYIW